MTNNYGIAMQYSNDGCDIYYGDRSAILNKLIVTTGEIYGTFYSTEPKMMDQIEYFKREKDNVRIHRLEQKEIA